MSQSDAHRNLVIQVVNALVSRHPRISILTDLQQNPGDDVTPVIGGFRPDVYARKEPANSIVIAEAKTDRDLDNKHANDQIVSFINYLERFENGLLVLSVSGCAANRAKTLMRFMHQVTHVTKTRIEIFDGCDFWLLDSTGDISWHLS